MIYVKVLFSLYPFTYAQCVTTLHLSATLYLTLAVMLAILVVVRACHSRPHGGHLYITEIDEVET